ncbi:MAG: PA-phosphatase [Reichenbachiella sp.]|uniref:PA-phosphatase n=1 Tax=Reichenbachiella sp. TaxID=2184521 RepID=UPI0032644B0C
MEGKLNKVISYLFHPLLMPTMTFLILYRFMPEIIKPLTIVTLPFLFITTFMIPVLSISVLKFSGHISNFSLDKREERIMPFFFVSIFYGLTAYLFVFKIQVNDVIATLLLATSVLVVLLTVITLWFKISIHAAGISGVVGFFIAFGLRYPDSQALYPLMFLTIAAGLVMSARLQLNAHTPQEIIAGLLVGLSICSGAMFIV